MALLKLASFIYLSTQVVKVISIGDLAPRAFRIIVIISRNSLSPFNNRHAENGVHIYIYICTWPVAYVLPIFVAIKDTIHVHFYWLVIYATSEKRTCSLSLIPLVICLVAFFRRKQIFSRVLKTLRGVKEWRIFIKF